MLTYTITQFFFFFSPYDLCYLYFRGYNGWHRDASSLRSWVYDYLPTKVITLTSQNFYSQVLDSSMPWIVDFYAPWCGHCQVFKPQFEQVAEVGPFWFSLSPDLTSFLFKVVCFVLKVRRKTKKNKKREKFCKSIENDILLLTKTSIL